MGNIEIELHGLIRITWRELLEMNPGYELITIEEVSHRDPVLGSEIDKVIKVLHKLESAMRVIDPSYQSIY